MNSFFLRRQHNKHVHSFKLWPHLHNSCFGEVLFQPLQQRKTQLFVSNLTTTEMNGRLHLVAIVKYANRIVLFEHIVVLIRARPELDLLNGNERLFRFSFFLFLLLLILVFAEINDTANRWLSLWCNFDEIETLAPGDFNCLLGRHDADLSAVFVDDPDLANSYSLIHSNGRNAVPSVSEASPLIAADTISS